MEKILIYSDGGARGNPGPAGIGCVIQVQRSKPMPKGKAQNVVEISKYIGEKTNNQAEYQAVIEALKWIANHPKLTPGVKENGRVKDNLEIEFFLDSELVVEQLNQRYKVKNEGLKPLFFEIRDLVMELGGKITFKHIPREQNKKADRLVNEAIDRKIQNPKSK